MVRKMWRLMWLAAALYTAYKVGLPVGYRIAHWINLGPLPYHHYAVWLIGGLAVGLPIVWTGKIIALLTMLDLAGSTSVLVRRPIGFLYGCGAFVISLAVASAIYTALLISAVSHGINPTEQIVNVSAVLTLLGSVLLHNPVKARLGKMISPLRRVLRNHAAGRGGSAKITGLFDEWANPWRSGSILLGQSLYDPEWKIGLKDDRHGLVMAASRAGKGRSVIIPNLLTWPHSALVIDPKGTNAAVTAARRGKGGYRVKKGMGQTVHVLNPFRVNEAHAWMPKGSRFNPLSILDPNSLTFYEDLDLIADGLVIPSTSGESFFDNSAKGLLRSLIGYSVAIYGKTATLFNVRELLGQVMQKDSPVIAGMLACPGVIADGAAQIANAEDRVKSNIVVTAMQQTDWLGSEAMQDALSNNDFSISDLKARASTIYLVLPPEYLETHSRFLRLFVNITIKVASMQGKSKTPILFMLDEFYSLGPMPSLSKAIGNLAGYNIKLFPIIQNLGQLIELYPRNWETFISNAGHFQVFSINDSETAGYVSSRFGRAVIYQDDGNGGSVPAGSVDLRDAGEASREGSRIEGKQIVFREGEDPLVIRRMNYETAFPKSSFNPDPDQKVAFRWLPAFMT